MTKAFLLGFIAGGCVGMNSSSNPYPFHDTEDDAAHYEWQDGYTQACRSWENPMQDILKMGDKP